MKNSSDTVGWTWSSGIANEDIANHRCGSEMQGDDFASQRGFQI